MKNMRIPNLERMSEHEIKQWFSSLSTEVVLANLAQLSKAIQRRLGAEIAISTATYTPPKLIQLVD